MRKYDSCLTTSTESGKDSSREKNASVILWKSGTNAILHLAREGLSAIETIQQKTEDSSKLDQEVYNSIWSQLCSTVHDALMSHR